MNDITDTNDDLVSNPQPRCACMLVLDTSSSMDGAPISELNEGARQFLQEVKKDDFARYSVEVGIITFGGRVDTVLDIGPLPDEDWEDFWASGNTPMGEAVTQAMAALAERKEQYKQNGVSYYQPWLVLMTDGGPNDYNWEEAARQLRELADNRGVTVIGVGIGDGCDMDVLAEFCPSNRPPAKLSGLKFREFFQWLSASMSQVSQSQPGGNVELPSISGWGSVEG